VAVIPVPPVTSAPRIRWRTVMTVVSVAWIIAFVVLAATIG
jgi:hypothetical protein